MSTYDVLFLDTMMAFTNPDFVISKIQHPNKFDMYVIDESHLMGGSKQRILINMLSYVSETEIIYSGPSTGYAQIAISYCCMLLHKKATIFIDVYSNEYAPLTNIAKLLNAKIIYFNGPKNVKRLNYIQNQAQQYNKKNKDSYSLPFGMNNNDAIDLYKIAFSPLLKIIDKKYKTPERLWVVAGSGLIFTSLSKIFPTTKLMIVQVGAKIWPDQLDGINHELFISEYAFKENISEEFQKTLPYNSLLNYDAKVWPFIIKYGEPGDFIWNTAGNPWHYKDIQKIIKTVDVAKHKCDIVINNYINKLTDLPPHTLQMKSPALMFKELKKQASKLQPDVNVYRNFTTDYYTTDGISNHFTEHPRMLCLVNAGERLNPINFWKKHKNQIIVNSIKYSNSTDDYLNIYEALASMKNFKQCNTFNPFILINVIKKYFTNQSKTNVSYPISILDPSMGWGDRLIAALSLNVSRYVGFDPNIDLHPCYDKLNSSLNKPRIFSGKAKQKTEVTFIPDKFTCDLKHVITESFDLVFTSPPFYDFEVYTHTENDIKCSYQEWLKSMYIPYITDMVNSVKKDGYIGIYTSNIWNANIADDTNKLLQSLNMKFVEELYFFNSYYTSGLLKHGSKRPLFMYKK